MAPFSVQGKTAIVTGAGSGINLAFADLLLTNGCNVVIADIKLRPEAEALMSRYSGGTDNHNNDRNSDATASRPPRAVHVKTDVTVWMDLQGMFDRALAEFGSFDIVCPGAGIFEPTTSSFWHPPGTKPSVDAVDGDRYATVEINVTHPIRTTQLALQHWLRSPSSPQDNSSSNNIKNDDRRVIVHVVSIASYVPFLPRPIYAATKAAIASLTRSLAQLEPALGIRVVAVAPGIVRTPIWTEAPSNMAFFDDARDRWVTPEEVARAMLECVVAGEEDRPGGAVVEVGAGGAVRCVSTYGDPGPDMLPGKGFTTSRGKAATNELLDMLRDGSWQA